MASNAQKKYEFIPLILLVLVIKCCTLDGSTNLSSWTKSKKPNFAIPGKSPFQVNNAGPTTHLTYLTESPKNLQSSWLAYL